MPPRRLRHRIARHHVVLGLGTAVATALLQALFARPDAPNDITVRWSMATAYAGLVLIAASLVTGPLNVLRRRPNPVSSDLRRDIGIWAGTVSVVHFVVGWQVHMKHRWEYWFHDVEGTGGLALRLDLFGFANHTGLAAVLIVVLLLALSNDRSLRAFGTIRWKALQRWNYVLFALVLAHGAAYQVSERRALPVVAAFVLLVAATTMLQAAGYRAWLAAAVERSARQQ